LFVNHVFLQNIRRCIKAQWQTLARNAGRHSIRAVFQFILFYSASIVAYEGVSGYPSYSLCI
jgi:hypothetical protein